ncbi:MAG TPA: hypothetical protein VFV87_23330 [Pirellulaceae bacterium]|nr:hypothetical protein [Pirellulaceae bacterium]
MADELYAVVQSKLERIEPAALETALVSGGGIPKPDASRSARKSRGFLAQRISKFQADGIAKQLIAAGHAVRVLPMSQLADVGKPVSVTWLRLTPEALGVPIGAQELVLDVPWSSVFVVNAGHLSVLEQKHREIETRDFRGFPQYETQKISQSERHPAVEVIGLSAEGSLVYLRLISLRMQGTKIPGVPLDLPRHMQFFFVLERLAALSTAAFVSPETRKMLADRKVDRSKTEGSLQFEADERAFTDYSRWLLQLVMFREAEQTR